jgi:outer membrane protein W
MRRNMVLLGLALAAASPALAQSNQGAFGLDAMVAPTTQLGFAYYVTDGLSLRPWVGLGYSDYSGFFANVGAQLRYEFSVDNRLSPYLSATAQYSHYGNSGTTPIVTTGSGGYQTLAVPSDLGQLGAGVGLRYRISPSLGVFAEGRALYATAPIGSLGTGWSSIGVNDRTHVDAILGVSYIFR